MDIIDNRFRRLWPHKLTSQKSSSKWPCLSQYFHLMSHLSPYLQTYKWYQFNGRIFWTLIWSYLWKIFSSSSVLWASGSHSHSASLTTHIERSWWGLHSCRDYERHDNINNVIVAAGTKPTVGSIDIIDNHGSRRMSRHAETTDLFIRELNPA